MHIVGIEMKKAGSIAAVVVALISLLTSPIWGPPICRATQVCPDEGPLAGADCLVGEWSAAFISDGPSNIDGRTVMLTGPTPVQSYRHGKAISNFGDGTTRTGTDGPSRYERTLTGTISNDYTVEGDEIVYSHGDASGARYVDRKDGVIIGQGQATAIDGRERFECSGDTLTTYGTSSVGFEYSQTWHRVAE